MPSQEQSDLPSPAAASEINRLHAKFFAALRTSIQDAIRIGELLTEAKQKAGHGGFANEQSNDLATSKEE